MDKDQWEPVQEPGVDVVCVTKTIRRAWHIRSRHKARQQLNCNHLLQTAEDLATAVPVRNAAKTAVAAGEANVKRHVATEDTEFSEKNNRNVFVLRSYR